MMQFPDCVVYALGRLRTCHFIQWVSWRRVSIAKMNKTSHFSTGHQINLLHFSGNCMKSNRYIASFMWCFLLSTHRGKMHFADLFLDRLFSAMVSIQYYYPTHIFIYLYKHSNGFLDRIALCRAIWYLHPFLLVYFEDFNKLCTAFITFLLFPFWTYHKLGIPNRVVDRASKIVGLIQDGNPIDCISTNNVKLKEVSYKVCFTIVYLLQKIHVFIKPI